jgi:hypothetical protein
MVIIIVAGAVYSYQKVEFGRKLSMVYQLAAGNMNGPGGAPPGGGQPPGNRPEGGQGRGPGSEGGFEGQPSMQGRAEGQAPNMQPRGEGGERGGFPPGGEAGQRPQGEMNRAGGPGGPPGTSWYKVSVRNVLPYTFILAFFALITCIIEGSIKRFSRSKSAS